MDTVVALGGLGLCHDVSTKGAHRAITVVRSVLLVVDCVDVMVDFALVSNLALADRGNDAALLGIMTTISAAFLASEHWKGLCGGDDNDDGAHPEDPTSQREPEDSGRVVEDGQGEEPTTVGAPTSDQQDSRLDMLFQRFEATFSVELFVNLFEDTTTILVLAKNEDILDSSGIWSNLNLVITTMLFIIFAFCGLHLIITGAFYPQWIKRWHESKTKETVEPNMLLCFRGLYIFLGAAMIGYTSFFTTISIVYLFPRDEIPSSIADTIASVYKLQWIAILVVPIAVLMIASALGWIHLPSKDSDEAEPNGASSSAQSSQQLQQGTQIPSLLSQPASSMNARLPSGV